MRDLWVDFNDVENDEVTTLLSFAEREIEVGATVVVGDDDETTCSAVVTAIDGNVVSLRIDRTTLRHGPTDASAVPPPAKTA